MLMAAAGGHWEICQLLSRGSGTHDEIRQQSRHGVSPVRVALHYDHVDVVRWLILNGALSPNDDVVMNNTMMRNDLNQEIGDYWRDDKRLTVLSWAQHFVAAYEKVNIFLTGTIVSTDSSSYLRCVN